MSNVQEVKKIYSRLKLKLNKGFKDYELKNGSCTQVINTNKSKITRGKRSECIENIYEDYCDLSKEKIEAAIKSFLKNN